ncbi:MAG: class I SAM-dependent methyltransferase [Thermoplasmata archaeon]|nr:class I SAM-dependent methyltransferase [Thermoplasmata archaeon]
MERITVRILTVLRRCGKMLSSCEVQSVKNNWDSIETPATSLLKNQILLSNDKSRINDLITAVGRTGDLSPNQWIQLMAFVLEFKPDFILELGRGYGNSTCAFTEVCHLLPPRQCKVLSVCLSDEWNSRTVSHLKKVVEDEWFEPVTTITGDILDFNYEKYFSGKNRIVIFWDAHGFEVAEIILGHILPLIKDKNHIVIMHDLSDSRYISGTNRLYGNNGIWKGKNDGPRIRIEHVDSCVEQSISAIDFCNRNKITLHSSDDSYFTEISDKQWQELSDVIGADYISKNGHWFWFSLNEALTELTFPKILEVKNYWDSRPCNIRHSPKEIGTLEYFNEIETRKYLVEPHIPVFVEFERWKGKKVLEIGCGIGTDTINFARNGAEVTAVDISGRSLDIAKKRAAIFGFQNNIRFYCADAEELSSVVPISKYDLIYSFGVIHHTPNPERVLDQIRLYAKSGTEVKIMVYHKYSWKVFWIIMKYGWGQFWKMDELVAKYSEAQTGCPVTYTYSKKQFCNLLERYGFAIKKVMIDHIFPYRIPDYIQYRYVKVWYFRWIPQSWFRLLEHCFGWHLCVSAVVK